MSRGSQQLQHQLQQQQQIPLDDDVLNPKIASAAFDFLLIELVPLAQRITEQLHTRERVLIEEYKRSRILNRTALKSAGGNGGPSAGEGEDTAAREGGKDGSQSAKVEDGKRESTSEDVKAGVEEGGRGGGEESAKMTSLGFPVMGESTREGALWRLDGMGYRVGQGLVERYVVPDVYFRVKSSARQKQMHVGTENECVAMHPAIECETGFSVNKPRPTNPLEAIKFICKDLWILVFRKQIDNLKTNHRGIFVLTDTRFQAIGRMSVDRRAGPKAVEDAMERAQTLTIRLPQYLYFPCGIIRGALMGLGVEATVEASAAELPIATFHIKTKGAKP
ncbi:hypothetical protein D0860_01785 [Hortaea werneckii]|uniref:Transport protein particle component n=1 Tax=Hortaea werneckii TaxID=91943 RepID=A0A3M7HPM8_HORWE|nr:hypothetical protein D0860_01785 [Hortaea werneckii]